MNSTTESKNLDLLRSLAVLYVLLFHILRLFRITALGSLDIHQLGHFGVLLFFVHTSMVLMFSIERQLQRESSAAWFGAYYLRRFFRIFPLSILIILAVYFLRLPVGHLIDGTFSAVHLTRHELFANLLLVQNITHADSIIAPLWSLPFEIQMYLVLPFLFLITRMSRNVIMIAAVWMLSVLAAISSQHIHRVQISGLVIYVPCFVAGVVAYKLAQSRSRNWPFFTWPLFLLAVTAAYLLNSTIERAWLCCLLVGVAIPQFREMPAGWCSRACQQIARYSYGIYLTHFIAIWFSLVALHALPLAARWLVLLVTLVLFPVVLYHAVENPMIAVGRQLTANFGAPRPQFRRLPVPNSAD